MIKEIKSRRSCIEYLSRHGIRVKNGGRCVSPLRSDAKNPTSFWVQDDYWYDFGTASGGDVIDLAAQMQFDGDVGAAVRGLAAELGIQRESNPRWKDEIQQLCNRTAYYQEALTASDYEYLFARGLSMEDIQRLRIGRVTDGYLKGRLFLPYFKNGYVCYYATRAMAILTENYEQTAIACKRHSHIWTEQHRGQVPELSACAALHRQDERRERQLRSGNEHICLDRTVVDDTYIRIRNNVL